MEAVLLCGIQASGKTTFYLDRYLRTHVRISLDMLKTRARERLLIEACHAAKQAYVVDDTNATVAVRSEHIARARAAGFRVVCYELVTELGAALARNRDRPQGERVPRPAIVKTRAQLEEPTWDEGFDALFRVRISDEGAFVVAPVERR